MAQDELTDRQRERLHRWFDGELDAAERADVESWVQSDPAAREYVDRLREVRRATTAAHREVASAGSGLDADAIVEAAVEAPPLEEEPLRELAPLLERYYDGETVTAEERRVERLVETREDVRAYLDALEEIGDSVRLAEREAASAVDFEQFSEHLEGRLDEEERSAELLHRYADGELDEARRERAEAWLEEDESARDALSAIEAVGEAARLAVDEERARAELDDLWDGIERQLDDRAAPGGAEDSENVVSLDAAREETDAETDESADSDDSRGALASAGSTVVHAFSNYSQHLVGAAAAAVVLLAAAALLRPGIFQQGTQPKKTVVIVDSVEYSSGSSVVVDSPMRQVRTKSSTAKKKKKTDDQEKPTVIWLLDSNGGEDESDEDGDERGTKAEPSESPAGDGSKPGRDAADETGETPDAGGPEGAEPSRPGQPI